MGTLDHCPVCKTIVADDTADSSGGWTHGSVSCPNCGSCYDLQWARDLVEFQEAQKKSLPEFQQALQELKKKQELRERKETLSMFHEDWKQYYPSEAAVVEDLFAESIPRAEKYTFKGEGWYFMGSDVLLVTKTHAQDAGFEVYCWNSPARDPRDVLRGICDLGNQTWNQAIKVSEKNSQ